MVVFTSLRCSPGLFAVFKLISAGIGIVLYSFYLVCIVLPNFSPRFSFFFRWISLGLVVWPRFGDLFVSQNPGDVHAFHFPRQILGCAFACMIKFLFLPHFPVDPPATVVSSFFPFYANLIHLLIMWLIVSFLSQNILTANSHCLHLIFFNFFHFWQTVIIFTPLRAFHTWWSFPGVWVITTLLRSLA